MKKLTEAERREKFVCGNCTWWTQEYAEDVNGSSVGECKGLTPYLREHLRRSDDRMCRAGVMVASMKEFEKDSK